MEYADNHPLTNFLGKTFQKIWLGRKFYLSLYC
nr:MAG TPA: hypothetical protein [Caudoviricetes sp.]